MTDILEQIFYGEYSGQAGPSETYRRLLAESEPLWEQVYAAVGQKTGDRLRIGQRAMQRSAALESFKEGTRLGVLLMLELLYG